MSSDLPSEFDVVVLGTGMPESILAAAFSRIGKTVLHLDRNPYYSGDWASFNLQGIEKWTQQLQGKVTDDETVKRPSVDEGSLLEEGETLVQLPLTNTHFSQPKLQYYVSHDKCQSRVDENVPKTAVQLNQGASDTPSGSPPSGSVSEKHDVSLKTECQTSPEGDGGEMLEHGKVADIESGVSKLDIEEHKKDYTNIDPSKSTDRSEESQDCHVVESELSKQNVEESGKNLPEEGSEELKTTEQKQEHKMETESVTEKVEKSNKWTKEKMQSEWRRFNLDLTPKVVYSGGDMVELLITSDIAKYCEFKTVTRLLTLMNGAIEQVPCSRADVFSSKKLSMMEKRMLMKFLQTCVQFEANADTFKDYLDRPFTELLASWKPKLTTNIQYYIQHSIAMATDSTTTTQALEQMKKFFKSLGRYGNTAFLWSLYGSGELPQSFCRLCAVFGGTYVLNMSVSSLVVEEKENRCTGVITTGGQKIKAKWVVMEASYAPDEYIHKEKQRHISRAIILADKPLMPSDNQELSLMTIPCPDDGERPILLLEVPSSSMASPKGVYVYHLTRPSTNANSAEDDLSQIVNTLFTTAEGDQGDDRPAILWSLYFTQLDMSSPLASDKVPDNVILMSGPGTDFDLDRPVQEAKGIFTRLLPDEEFLPKAPNPEDIIYVDDNQASVSEGSERVEYSETGTNSQTGGDNPGPPAGPEIDIGTAVSDKNVSAISDDVSATGDIVSVVGDIVTPVDDIPPDNVSVVSDAVSVVGGHVSVISDAVSPIGGHVSVVSDNVSRVDGHVSVISDNVSAVDGHVSVVSGNVSVVDGHVSVISDDVPAAADNVSVVSDAVSPAGDTVSVVSDSL